MPYHHKLTVPGEWLGLSDVAQLLGVHPSTVRSWSDQGHLPVHRTQGGHRRYRRSEVELWVQSRQASGTGEGNLVVQNALRNTRLQIGEGRLESEGWYKKLDDEARSQLPAEEGVTARIAQLAEEAVAEAKPAFSATNMLARLRNRLTAAEATRRCCFPQCCRVDAYRLQRRPGIPPSAWSDIFTKVAEFTDLIQLTLLETYEAYQQEAGEADAKRKPANALRGCKYLVPLCWFCCSEFCLPSCCWSFYHCLGLLRRLIDSRFDLTWLVDKEN
jgi:excisionase family DNA binding protein